MTATLTATATRPATRANGTSVAALYEELPRSAITPNPGQPRKYFDQGAIDELAKSLLQVGQLQPIVVRPRTDGTYQIIAGERRWRAAGVAGLATLTCRVLTDLTEEEAFVLAVTENLLREDFNPIEEAQGYADIVALGRTVQEVAKLFGKDPFAVQWRIDLLNLREDLQQLTATGQLSLSFAHNVALLSLEGQGELIRRYNAGEFANQDVAVRTAKAILAREQQTDLFAVPVDPLAGRRAQVGRKKLTSAWEQLAEAKLGATLDAFLELSPAEIAAALGPDVSLYAERFALIARSLGKVRTALSEAQALNLAGAIAGGAAAPTGQLL